MTSFPLFITLYQFAFFEIFKLSYSALIWWSFIVAIGDLRSKLPLLKPPIINAHAHSNARVHQITKLKTANYIFMG